METGANEDLHMVKFTPDNQTNAIRKLQHQWRILAPGIITSCIFHIPFLFILVFINTCTTCIYIKPGCIWRRWW